MMFKSIATALLASTALQYATAAPLEPRQTANVYTSCTVPNTVALTFDDGPWQYLNDIVNAFDAAGAKATFFFRGCIYDTTLRGRVKYAYDHGHQVASHTWAHKDLATLTWDQMALSRITGAYPAWVRPPYGSYNTLVQQAAGNRGMSLVNWDLDAGDADGVSVAETRRRYDERINQHPNTILALNHETLETTAHQTVPYMIQRLQAAGYRLVTLAECLGQPAYKSVAAPQTPTSDWHC
ncbi:hypothetical protein NMY22_g10412 [Coprinellus aureogranulatus]|nr:hypothetical protein NMY22_g10412 [Coprinellus aureogranulatus]